MVTNSFSKEEVVAFEKLLQGFQDALVLSEHVTVFTTDQVMMERAGDTIWRPQPFIAVSYDGPDMTNNFNSQTQLSVPASIGYWKTSPWPLTVKEMRDPLQAERLRKSAEEKLASDINYAILSTLANQGTIVVTKSSAAADFGDVANIEGALNRLGVQGWEREVAFTTGTYNLLAKDLANRQNMVDMTKEAYRRGYVGMVANFDTWKLDYSIRCAAATGGAGLTMDTRSTASNYWVPKAIRVASTGEKSNVDNRYQQVTISSTTNVAAGDCFTIAGIYEAHHIRKSSTGSLKTFRVISVDSSTLLTISPPIISNQGGSMAEQQYQNCVVTTSASAAIVFLNTQAADINPFWQKGAIELLPGRLPVPTDAGVGVLRSTTEEGIELCLQKWYDINTTQLKYRVDCLFGVSVVQPEMCGIALYGQS